MRSGFVYVLSNRGLTAYKVGMTTRTLYLRAAELRREYGTEYPFEQASRHAVDNPAAVEALAHRFLARYRVPRSELFGCDLKTCQAAIFKAARVVRGECPAWLRVWYWLTLPRTPKHPAQRWRRRSDGGGVALVLLLGFLFYELADYIPGLPHVPFLVSRLALAIARLH